MLCIERVCNTHNIPYIEHIASGSTALILTKLCAFEIHFFLFLYLSFQKFRSCVRNCVVVVVVDDDFAAIASNFMFRSSIFGCHCCCCFHIFLHIPFLPFIHRYCCCCCCCCYCCKFLRGILFASVVLRSFHKDKYDKCYMVVRFTWETVKEGMEAAEWRVEEEETKKPSAGELYAESE